MKVIKSEVVEVMKQLKARGYGHEELAVALGKKTQTIWAWSSNAPIAIKRIPDKANFTILKRLLE